MILQINNLLLGLNEAETKIQNEAIKYVKDNKDRLIRTFISSKNPIPLGLYTLFMAGSPGAGKTEFSKRYIPLLLNKNDLKITQLIKERGFDNKQYESMIIRIDVDEIREFLPQYKKSDHNSLQKGNSHIIQKAANKGLDILRDYCLKNKISFLHDGTFGNFSTMRKIIKQSIKNNRKVIIYYIYLDPIFAWKFTQAREYIEGRNIIKEKFIEQYFASRLNVDIIKTEFGSQIEINCVLKDEKNNLVSTELNVKSVENFLKIQTDKRLIKEYNYDNLLKSLSEV